MRPRRIPVTVFVHVARPAGSRRAGVGIILESGGHRKALSRALAADTLLDAELLGGAEALRAITKPEQAVVAVVTDAFSIPRVLHESWTPAAASAAALDLRAMAERCAAFAAVYRPTSRLQELEEAARLARAAVAPASQAAPALVTA